MESGRTILGLDQALCNTGYVLITPRGRIITKGVIVTTSKEEYYKRLVYIESEVKKLINIYKPEMTYLEDVYVRGGRANAYKLKDVKLVIELMLYKSGYNYTVMSAALKTKNSWRKFLGIKTADKQAWCDQINEENEHIADAIGIAKGGLKYTKSLTQKCNNSNKKPKKRKSKK